MKPIHRECGADTPAVIFRAIASIPIFELWLLLHYEDIQARILRDEAMRRLKQHIPGYEKSADSAFAITCDRHDIATQRPNALATRFNAKTDPEPYTAIVELVTLLISLRVSN